jgi:hypothetical protein
VSGFAIEFEWLGNGLPDAQTFVIFDPSTNALLETGRTGNKTPESGTLGLFLLGVFAALRVRFLK